MHFTAPVLLLSGPVLAALVTGLLGRWPRLVPVAGLVVTWFLGAMVIAVPLSPTALEQSASLFAGDTWLLLGRALILTEGIRTFFLFLLAGLSLLFLVSLLLPQGRHFVPGTLLVLSPLTASLMIETVAFKALSLLLAMIVMAAIIQAGAPGSTRASLRYLIMAILAVPLLLVAGWMLSTGQSAFLAPASRLLLIGFVILFAGFPFHIWVTPVISQAPALISVFMFGLFQLVVTAFIFDLKLAAPWLSQDVWFVRMVAASGTVTALAAGLLAATADRFGRLVGSLVLLDLGICLLTLTLGSSDGWSQAVASHLARFASLLLLLVGLRLLLPPGRDAGAEAFASWRGAAWRAPWATALLAYGGLSLIGLPLTVGYAARWSLLVNSPVHLAPWLPYMVLLAMIGGLIGLFRTLSIMLLPTDVEPETATAQSLWRRGLTILLLFLGCWLALFPQVAQAYGARLVQLFG